MDNYGLPSSDGQFGFLDLLCPSKLLGRYFAVATVSKLTVIKNLQLFLEKIFIFWTKRNRIWILNFKYQINQYQMRPADGIFK